MMNHAITYRPILKVIALRFIYHNRVSMFYEKGFNYDEATIWNSPAGAMKMRITSLVLKKNYSQLNTSVKSFRPHFF